jgi:uncharacterized membrane protein
MLKLLFAVVVGLIGAVLLHIIIILALPHFTGKDAYTRITFEGAANRFYSLGSQMDKAGLSSGDPFLKLAVCAFDVSVNPVRITASAAVPFWSIGVFDRNANEAYSMNDSTSVEGKLDIIAATSAQIARLRAEQSDSLTQTIFVEMPTSQGYAVLRVMVPQDSFKPDADAFLKGARCKQISN